MRVGLRCLALSGLLVMIAAAPISAEKIRVKCDYDKSNDFTRYKRYSLGKNFLLTHQTPEVQARINQVLVESINRHLEGKGFLLDQNHPDFVITYEAGSLAEADTSLPPDIYYGVPTDSPAFGQIGLEGIPAEVWTYALAKLKLTVTDVVSGQPVWTARASERIPYPKNALKNLRTRVDDLMAKTLKSFPPASKPK